MRIKEKMCKSLWFQLLLASVVGILVYNASVHAEDAEEWMPDPALRKAVREQLQIPDGIPIHPADMAGLHDLIAEHDIQRLKGLEHAVNLRGLFVIRSEVSDLTPLAGLENLQVLKLNYNRITDISPLSGLVNLQRLQLHNNQIVDISPLAGLIGLRDLRMKSNEVVDISPLSGLVNLQYLQLHDNQISDLTPLAGLENLQLLKLSGNRITDISPLAGLVNLEELILGGNPITDFTPIYGLVEVTEVTVEIGGIPIDFEILQRLNPADRIVCDIEREPIRPRIENRTYPSIFQVTCANIINRPELSWSEQIAYDLFSCTAFGAEFFQGPDGLVLRLHEKSREAEGIRKRRPNILFLAGTPIGFHAAGVDEYPEDSPYYFRDKSGNRIIDTRWGTVALLDFRHPDVQKRFIQQAREFSRCGIFDGIAIDKWASTGHGDMPRDEHVAAKDRMIQGIRDAVDDDFLILVTTGNDIMPTRHQAEYINGFFMETTEDYEGGYTHAGLAHIENTLSWAEENLREPQINCLAGRGDRNELLDSPRNLQWMRLWTTMSLTHSDGYVVFTMGGGPGHPPHPFEFWPGHADLHAQGIRHGHQNTHYHYDFWDADLGRPIGGDETKAQLYEDRDGLFIREFTNGWAVYNRSGAAQEIELPQAVSGWSSGVEHQRRHTLADLDGEIYLKAKASPTADVNRDGIVNIQDLVIVANALGEAEPDINGDGVVNIQDLVIVANAF